VQQKTARQVISAGPFSFRQQGINATGQKSRGGKHP
jgi:hypothetical protein